MHLTTIEEKMYDSEYGWACQISMQILTRLGDLFDSTRLIPIKSAHLSGCLPKLLEMLLLSFRRTCKNSGENQSGGNA